MLSGLQSLVFFSMIYKKVIGKEGANNVQYGVQMNDPNYKTKAQS